MVDRLKLATPGDIIYLLDWPPVASVHVLFAVAVLGVVRFLMFEKTDSTNERVASAKR